RRAERQGVEETEPHPAGRRALDQVPLAERWATAFVDQVGGIGAHHPGAAVVEIATVGLATACVPDPPGMLRDLLADAITLCEQFAGREQADREQLAPDQCTRSSPPPPSPDRPPNPAPSPPLGRTHGSWVAPGHTPFRANGATRGLG